MMRVPTPLDDETEQLVHTTIGCCITVHRELGPGLLERIYCRGLAIELGLAGLPFELERPVDVFYRERLLSTHRLDVVVAGKILIEAKAIDRFAPVHYAQVISYLRGAGLRVGLLVNFNVAVLADGLRR